MMVGANALAGEQIGGKIVGKKLRLYYTVYCIVNL